MVVNHSEKKARYESTEIGGAARLDIRLNNRWQSCNDSAAGRGTLCNIHIRSYTDTSPTSTENHASEHCVATTNDRETYIASKLLFIHTSFLFTVD